MKHIVTASIVVFMVILTISFCHALSMDDNGFTWNSSDTREREDFCKLISERLGRHCQSWLNDISSVFNTDNPVILNMKIKSVLGSAYSWHRATAERGRLANRGN
jgi:hypothetical protein